MLRAITSKSVGRAKKYYSEGLTREGYYSGGQEMAGQWGGKAARLMGLTGSVQKDAYHNLCDNLHPVSGQKLTPRFNTGRRVGWDLNFNCPKSVTLAHAIFKDERIFPAFCKSVRLTMRELEQEAATRVRMDGRDEDRITGKLAWSEYFHFTARPVDGIVDPHLHAHCFVFNITWDDVEQRWKAAQMGEILRKINQYQAMFHAHLSEELQALGYDIVPVKGSFEIAGMPRSLSKKFSRRTEKIMAEARRRGYTTAAERDGLAALTREKKIKDLTIEELEPLWQARVSPEERKAFKGPARRPERVRVAQSNGKLSEYLGTGLGRQVPNEAANYQRSHEAVQFAIEHNFYQRSVVEEHELLTDAINWGYGRANMAGIKRAIKDFPLIYREINGRKFVTTREVLEQEQRIVQWCTCGKGTVPPLNPNWRIHDTRLNSQQVLATSHVLNSRDKITGFIGKAGVGKTTTLQEIARGIEATGRRVLAFAPTSVASRMVLRNEGFYNAETLDKFINSERMQAEAHGAVLFVDEGSLMSARQADTFLELAESLDCRVVVIGDPDQHHSVERGDAFRLMLNEGEISVVTVDKIVRQRGLYRRMVEEILQRKFDAAFETMEEMNALSEIPDFEIRYNAIAMDYVKVVQTGKTGLLVAPTHVECDAVTEKVRELLKARNKLEGGREWTVLRNLPWSPAQKHDFRHYEEGQVVKVINNMKGFHRGEHLEVTGTDEEMVLVRRPGGEIKPLPLKEAGKFSVYERETIEICEGERVRITCNGRNPEGHELNNGSIYTVKKLKKDGSILLDNGWTLPPEYGHLAYGYTDTSYIAQSKTIDVIFLAQSALISSGAIDWEQFYVALSRGREMVYVYTDDIEELREKVTRIRERKLAMEMMAAKQLDDAQELGMGLTI